MTDAQSIDAWTQDIHQGDVLETLAEMPESSVHCVVTSPPYWNLRDYGVDGQIGLEESPGDYVETLVEVGTAIERVLREDGTWWLNLGDTFSDGSASHTDGQVAAKNKILVPHRVAIALQEAGWIVRQDLPWIKDMPDPAHDRFRRGPEYVFQLAPTTEYWADERGFDHRGWFEFSQGQFPEGHFATFPEAMVEAPINASCPPYVCADCGTPHRPEVEEGDPLDNPNARPQKEQAIQRYKRSDLTTEHLEACRAVGFSDTGAGEACQTGAGANTDRVERLAAEAKEVLGGYFREFCSPPSTVVGWTPRCGCDTADSNPGIVLDPFAGSGTTARVAKRLGRRFIGIELNPEYVAMAQKRVGVDVDEPELLLEDDEQTLSAFSDGGSA